MRIKKHNGITYVLSKNNMWIRDFTKSNRGIDINNLTTQKEYALLVENERNNNKFNIPVIDFESDKIKKCVIVSDGYDFENKHQILTKLPKNVAIFAVNSVLKKWKISKRIDYYVINNPYPEATSYLPEHRYFPRCIASMKTNQSFIESYQKRGDLSLYCPSPETNFSVLKKGYINYVDDYRNPICAAINLAYHFDANKICLLCCDNAFKNERPSAEKLENDLWTYPQQLTSHYLIDANLYWLKGKVGVKSHSSGPNYENAEYISLDGMLDFLNGDL